MAKKTEAEIFANRIKDRFRTADQLIASDEAIAGIIESTNRAIRSKNADFGLIAEALRIIAAEAASAQAEQAQSIGEQAAAISHGLENRELWREWRTKAAGDTMLIKELRNVWFRSSPEMLADHLAVADAGPLKVALGQLEQADPARYALLRRLLGGSAD